MNTLPNYNVIRNTIIPKKIQANFLYHPNTHMMVKYQHCEKYYLLYFNSSYMKIFIENFN